MDFPDAWQCCYYVLGTVCWSCGIRKYFEVSRSLPLLGLFAVGFLLTELLTQKVMSEFSAIFGRGSPWDRKHQ